MPHSTTDPGDFTSRLFTGIPDAKVRYAVAAALRDRLPWIQAVSAAQLVADLGSVEAAATELGVTRQYLGRLMTEHEQPTPRKMAPEPTQAHRYGQLLGLYSHIAERCDQRRHCDAAWREYDKLDRNAIAFPRLLPAISLAAQRWLKPLHDREVLLQRLDEAHAAVGQLPEHLTLAEQSQAILGYHSARVALRAPATHSG